MICNTKLAASRGELTVWDAGHEALDVALRWPTEGTFDYRAYSHTIRCALAASNPRSPILYRRVANTSEVSPLTDISVRRTLKGTSQAEAQLTLVVTNNLPVQVSTGYLETMPWHLQFYLHTLQASVNGAARGKSIYYGRSAGTRHILVLRPCGGTTHLASELDSLFFDLTHLTADDLVSILSYTPPVPHSRPALLQAVLTLPPGSTLHLTMDVLKPFLRYTEHQPDAQRGWDLPPAVLVPFAFGDVSSQNHTVVQQAATTHGSPPDSRERRPRRIYTPILLVDLATPDFSMPYNVIILSCTLIALLFGSVFNCLTRKIVIVKVGPTPAPASAPASEQKGHAPPPETEVQ